MMKFVFVLLAILSPLAFAMDKLEELKMMMASAIEHENYDIASTILEHMKKIQDSNSQSSHSALNLRTIQNVHHSRTDHAVGPFDRHGGQLTAPPASFWDAYHAGVDQRRVDRVGSQFGPPNPAAFQQPETGNPVLRGKRLPSSVATPSVKSRRGKRVASSSSDSYGPQPHSSGMPSGAYASEIFHDKFFPDGTVLRHHEDPDRYRKIVFGTDKMTEFLQMDARKAIKAYENPFVPFPAEERGKAVMDASIAHFLPPKPPHVRMRPQWPSRDGIQSARSDTMAQPMPMSFHGRFPASLDGQHQPWLNQERIFPAADGQNVNHFFGSADGTGHPYAHDGTGGPPLLRRRVFLPERPDLGIQGAKDEKEPVGP